MNLRAIANTITQAVNPNVVGILRQSTGNTIGANFRQTPTFADIDSVVMQFQALSTREIEHLDSLNIQDVSRAVYLNGNVNGIDRQQQLGGDLLIADGATWLVRAVLEPWDVSGWTKVAVAKQVTP